MSASTATHLYFESGKMSGVPSHRQQVEFNEAMVEFFTPQEILAQKICIRLPNGKTLTRPLQDRSRKGKHITKIWRLGLPTKTQWGVQYVGRVVKLERQADGCYLIEVANAGSTTPRQWAMDAQANGFTGFTGQITDPGRSFGYW